MTDPQLCGLGNFAFRQTIFIKYLLCVWLCAGHGDKRMATNKNKQSTMGEKLPYIITNLNNYLTISLK
jgi:hypothetical protein